MDLAKENRIKFEYTARNLGELIRSPIKWGIDFSGTIHNLLKKEKFESKVVKLDRIVNNYVWLQSITYPFELPKNIDTVAPELQTYYYHILKIDGKWELYRILPSYLEKEYTWI